VRHQPVPREQRIEAWEGVDGHNCGNHTRCPDLTHQGCQWRYRDDPAA
jgi:hypothetical protein